MNASALLSRALDEAAKVRFRDGAIRLVREPSDPELTAQLRERLDEFSRLLAPGPGQGAPDLPYAVWNGEHLGQASAADTETRAIRGQRCVPGLAILTVTDGARNRLVHPDDVGSFLLRHVDSAIVFHNVAFDFWVLNNHVDEPARDALWRMAREGRLRDTMLLDALYQLARSDTFPKPRPLDVVARYYAA